jgi:hypothetical protein
MKLEILIFQDRFDIILEKRLSGLAGQEYTMLYGKSQFIWEISVIEAAM